MYSSGQTLVIHKPDDRYDTSMYVCTRMYMYICACHKMTLNPICMLATTVWWELEAVFYNTEAASNIEAISLSFR